MKVVEKYRCEICGTEYTDRAKAIACEKSHKKIKVISDCRYQPITVNSSGYPVTITVTFTDGHTATYKR